MAHDSTCEVVIFPLTRRLGQIRRLAQMVSNFSPSGADNALHHQLHRKWCDLVKLGLPPADADDEVARMQRAIRREMARLAGGQLQA